MDCTLCQTHLTNKADEYFFICNTCGAFVKDKKHYLSAKEEKNRYDKHTNKVDDTKYQKYTSPITNAILEKYTPKHLGLDYGCGSGPVITKMLQDKGYQIKLFDPYFYPANNYLNYQYDYIFSCEVVEHFYNPKEETAKLIRLLKPNGHLYIMTQLYNPQIDFKNWHYRKDPTHVFIYTKKTILFIAKKYMLSIEKQNDKMIIFKKIPTKNK